MFSRLSRIIVDIIMSRQTAEEGNQIASVPVTLPVTEFYFLVVAQ